MLRKIVNHNWNMRRSFVVIRCIMIRLAITNLFIYLIGNDDDGIPSPSTSTLSITRSIFYVSLPCGVRVGALKESTIRTVSLIV